MALTRDNITYQSKYGDIPGINEAFNNRIISQAGIHSDSDGNRKGIAKNIDNMGDQFVNLFTNSVGRAPTQDEIGKFFQDQGNSAIQTLNGDTGQGLRNSTAQYIGDTFQKAAQDTATQKTQDLASQYGSLADQYMAMGKKSLGDLSDQLQSYSTSLFDKLRPQLNLAAQAGGYGDSGGQTLQERGALTDLANQGQGVLANAAYDVSNNANNIRYGGMAAPVNMASQFAANTPYAVQNLGQQGLGFNNQSYFDNLDYQHQLGLMTAQNKMYQEDQPSFGQTLGQSFGKSAGTGMGNFFNPTTYYKPK